MMNLVLKVTVKNDEFRIVMMKFGLKMRDFVLE